MKHFYAYLRKSTDRDDRQQLSLIAQREEIMSMIPRLEDAVGEKVEIIEWFEESISAKSEERPAFLDMMSRVKKKQVDGIIAWKLDRLSRNPTDSGRIMTALQNGYIKYIYTNDQGHPYTRKESGMMMGVLLALANQYILNLSEDVISKMKSKVEKWGIVSRVPFGLKHHKQTKSVAVVDDEAQHLPEIFEMAKQNISLREIGKWLYDRWHKTKPIYDKDGKLKHPGGKPYSPATISKWIKNRIYYGVYEWAGQYYEANVPQLVEKKLWEEANAALGFITLPRIHSEKNTFPLKGMVRSAKTGKPLSASLIKKQYVYYHTHARDRTKTENIKIGQRDILSWFDDKIDLYTPTPEVKKWLMEGLWEAHRDQFERISREKKRIVRELEDIDVKMSNLIDMRASGELMSDGFKMKQREYIDAEKDLKKELEDIIKLDDSILTSINEAVELWTNLSGIWKTTDEAWKAEIVKHIAVELFVDESVNLYVKENPILTFVRSAHWYAENKGKTKNKKPSIKDCELPDAISMQKDCSSIINFSFTRSDGSATENRTPVCGMKTRCPDH